MDAIQINNDFSKEICKSIHRAMSQAEDAMLALSSTIFVEGLFYCVVLQLGRRIVARYFEHGVFSGYFDNVFRKEIENEYKDVLPICVNTLEDIELENQRNNSLFEAIRKPSMYQFLTCILYIYNRPQIQ